MNERAEGILHNTPADLTTRRRRRVLVVSGDRLFAESLRSHLASEFDVLLAKDGGEASAKAQAVPTDLLLVDLGCPILGLSALARVKSLSPTPVVCALALPEAPDVRSSCDFDYILARPSSGADLPDRVRFILARAAT